MATVDLTKYGITGTTEIVHNPSYELLFEEETKADLQGYEKGQVSALTGAVNLYDGMLKINDLNQFGATLNIYGGILNYANGTLQTNTTTKTLYGDAYRMFDMNVATRVLDNVGIDVGSYTLYTAAVNVIADGSSFSYSTLSNCSFAGYGGTYTNNYKYSLSNTNATATVYRTSISSGLASAFADTSAYKAFSATSDYTFNFTSNMTPLSGTTLTIFGNKHSINANNTDSQMIMYSNATLNIFGVGELDESGNPIAGWTGHTSTDTDEILQIWGGSLSTAGAYSNSRLNISDSVFYNNGGMGALFSIAGANYVSVNNSSFINNSLPERTIFQFSVDVSAVFLDTLFKGNSTNHASYGSVITASSNSTNLSITGSTFENNTGLEKGAISNVGTMYITDSTFKGNKTTFVNGANISGGGGAIHNTGTAYILSSIFDGNTSHTGGAIFNSGNNGNCRYDFQK